MSDNAFGNDVFTELERKESLGALDISAILGMGVFTASKLQSQGHLQADVDTGRVIADEFNRFLFKHGLPSVSGMIEMRRKQEKIVNTILGLLE